ncbi:ribosome small subunit-dependent GTPase A [Pararhodobacter zhoushanensis]|uniref:Small ribosomal subunit biogenesis GTPase RsgA n=1 Tax=Pararhodobacter zhoushanensis TaxID=2479545 RepID=A0ABT3H1A0_9RHOB|nr:ribosome small subunit-dependent GTPase A [Pararhodobacter zhoushanensis]MCW1933582.1 ribosome small subunit-dependent GTPase A [Pararhodobacter zhoushanensis]
MTRDFSQFLPLATPPKRERSLLERLGWTPFFSQQIDPEALINTPPVRVTAVHRSGLHVMGNGIDTMIPPGPNATVGDWLLYDAALPANSEVLERKSLIERRAAGHDRRKQKIAANLDTAFLVTSCNDDFNVARLERYIALSFEAGVQPVIILTKPDLCDDTAPYVEQAAAISDRVPVEVLDALAGDVTGRLAQWCRPGQTVGFLGSSGVGKSTLVNALFNAQVAETQGIREDDSRGRHTTTHRQLHLTPEGCAVLDTPGMREIQLTDTESGIAEVFDDLSELALRCRFRDCRHESEPGCAVQAALASGEIDKVRLERWKKLGTEDRSNTKALHERKSEGKALRKQIKAALKSKRE